MADNATAIPLNAGLDLSFMEHGQKHSGPIGSVDLFSGKAVPMEHASNMNPMDEAPGDGSRPLPGEAERQSALMGDRASAEPPLGSDMAASDNDGDEGSGGAGDNDGDEGAGGQVTGDAGLPGHGTEPMPGGTGATRLYSQTYPG